MKAKIIAATTLAIFIICNISFASAETFDNYLKGAIHTESSVEITKSTILDASQSYIPSGSEEVTYRWDFGDGNKNEGVEVLHSYKTPGKYKVRLEITSGNNKAETETEIFAYKSLINLITDQTDQKANIEMFTKIAEAHGVLISVIESFGSSTEFISEEILTKKLTEGSKDIRKVGKILVWTKENAGLNALSRFVKSSKDVVNLSNKEVIVIDNNIERNMSRIQRQFGAINPQRIIIAQEGAIQTIIQGLKGNTSDLLQASGYQHKVINEKTGKLRPWNFIAYFVNYLIDSGVPDNTIALLLLLPVIATVVAFMRQVVGVTTFGIYTPSIITLSFLVIGLYAGLLTLAIAIFIGAISRQLLKHVRMLYIPKMAIVMTVVSLALLVILIGSTYIGLFNTQFLSIAIFPMLILSTLVEKFVSVKSEKGLSSAAVLMLSTVVVSIIAYIIAGGEVNFGFGNMSFTYVKGLLLSYPELIFALLVIDVLLGRWAGLRIMERIRFREVLRHIEE